MLIGYPLVTNFNSGFLIEWINYHNTQTIKAETTFTWDLPIAVTTTYISLCNATTTAAITAAYQPNSYTSTTTISCSITPRVNSTFPSRIYLHIIGY